MDRRRFLIGGSVVFSTAFAGCASDEDDGGNGNGQNEDEDENDGGNGDDNRENGAGNETDEEGETENGNGDRDDGDEDEETSDTDSTDGDDDVDEPDPQTFSGSGAEVHDDITIDGGLTVVEAEHTNGEMNFIVKLVPSEGEFDEIFVNQIGEWDGERAALVDADTYTLDVDADGDWDLEIRQPRAGSGESLPQSLEGDTARVFGPVEFDGSHTATGVHSGEQNFIVEVFPQEGSFGEVVFNEIGEFDGETTFRHDGVGWVAVQADGDWSLDLE